MLGVSVGTGQERESEQLQMKSPWELESLRPGKRHRPRGVRSSKLRTAEHGLQYVVMDTSV